MRIDRGGVFLEPVLAADHRVLVRVARERRRRRPQPQRLLEDLGDVGQLVDLGVGRQHAQVRAQHAVHFLIGPRQHVGVLEQRIERERQQAAGGLVAGDQEGDALGDDVGVVELLARLAVDAGQHPIEQVVDGAQRCRTRAAPG